MKLYYNPGVCSLSPHIAFREAGISFEPVKVDTKTHTLADGGDYYEINPRGYVPALRLDDGSVMTEGPAIVQYIADLNPESGLAPANGTIERYRLQEWLGFINSELHKGFSPLFNPAANPEYKTTVVKKLTDRLTWTARQLEGKQYLTGDRFTVADGYLFTVLRWTKGVGINLSDWPVLQSFSERVASRPAVRAALEAEGLLNK